ncbi:MAG: prepilin-type N-terminal cleavage/methylation domain-containing protein [Deltaproteobacteria bacterium]|nr:MAG: prepilin-type N-terminal cleavage/methylation domain-containing protein [Deltaproteobacteria bacterium]TMQ11840.1 MAG: prepilin-type N-terminal cleavage/methylation domain-containing protein [Deltaproteobacteria bacterium]
MTAPRMARSTNRTRAGFTLLEVMIGLAVLGLGLTVLIKSAAGNIFNAQQAHMMGIVTDLARAKMYDLEDKLQKDGFSDTEQHEDDQAFSDEGWPSIHYSYKVELVELPSFDVLTGIAQGRGSGAAGSGGAGAGSAEGGFQNSLLGGMLSQFGGMGGTAGGAGKGSGDVAAALGGSFVQSYYTMFQQILKDSVRKVTLTVTWQVMGSDRDMKVVTFLSDGAAMDKVLNGLGSQELPQAGSGSGSGGAGGTGGTGGGSGKKP